MHQPLETDPQLVPVAIERLAHDPDRTDQDEEVREEGEEIHPGQHSITPGKRVGLAHGVRRLRPGWQRRITCRTCRGATWSPARFCRAIRRFPFVVLVFLCFSLFA